VTGREIVAIVPGERPKSEKKVFWAKSTGYVGLPQSTPLHL
jgi:hypothetical protein